MDTSAWAASAFGGLPGFNPMIMINTSGTCATTRLIQCRNLGIYENDISRKFQRRPEDATDLSKDDFLARKAVIGQVSKWCHDNQDQPEVIYKNEWAPILYLYEIVKASAKRERDWGHLVFTDMTLTRFLLVMVFPSTCNCGNFSHHDYEALTKFQADRFMSLLKYLHYKEAKPAWVRATYMTKAHQFQVDPTFISSQDPPSPLTAESGSAKFPPILHITPDTFVPSLLTGDLEKIDNLLAQGNKEKPPTNARDKVLGSKGARPDVGPAWKLPSQRLCAYCEKPAEQKLSQCSRCKLVQYCGRECQKLAWPMHKLVCKKA